MISFVRDFAQKYRKNILVLFICVFAFLLILFSYTWQIKAQGAKILLLPNKILFTMNKKLSSSLMAQKSASGFEILTDLNFYSDLPVADVAFYEAPKAWATVLFVPQYHKYPGSNAEDSRNDQAERVQNETYQVLDKIVEQVPLSIIAIEGELHGPLQQNKRIQIAQKLNHYEQLDHSFQNLKKNFTEQSMYPELEENILKEIQNKLAFLERDLILAGAPVKLWAKHDNIQVFGTENPQTLDESKILVRDYIYLQDRLTALTQHKPYAQIPAFNKSFQAPMPKNSQVEETLSYLFDQRNDRNFEQDFHLLEERAKEENQLVWEALQDFKNIWNETTYFQNGNLENASTPEPQVSRKDNPYENIYDVSYLQRLMAENEEKIQETIISRRNKEAAYYFAQTLQSQNNNFGVLQFGAGHEQGLIEELKNLGLSVIMVKTFGVVNE